MNTLILEKRGCDFWSDDNSTIKSDVGNYRVYVEFTDKNNIAVCGDFCNGYTYNYYFKNGNRRTKRKLIDNIALDVNLEYTDEKGSCYGYELTKIDKIIDNNYLKYTQKDILKLVNELSEIQYDNVQIIGRG